MSVSQLILAANWLLEGNVIQKFKLFFSNKLAVIVSSILFIHFLGLLYTSDIDYALKDIRIKSPLFILPVIISTSQPLSEKLFDNLLKLLLAATLFTTGISALLHFKIIYLIAVETKGISIFISHIRFSLLICFSIFLSVNFLLKEKNISNKIVYVLIICWLSYFLTILGALTGIAVLIATLFVLVFYWILNSKNKRLKYSGLTLLTAFVIVISAVSYSFYKQSNDKDHYNYSALDKYTALGNTYEHDPLNYACENGHRTWMYYCNTELIQTWNRRCQQKIIQGNLEVNSTYNTLIRFLTSKGIRKDTKGVMQLTNKEILAIEKGIPNVNYVNFGRLRLRAYETLWEINVYRTMGDANGHSLAQRFEYWKAGIAIFKQHPLIGVGTGDVAKAFEDEYIKSNSNLAQKLRLRSHNQYLSIAVAFGFVGLMWFVISLLYPLTIVQHRNNFVYLAFLSITLVSFLTEDTLETQAGVTFFAFLNTYLLFAKDAVKTNDTDIV